MKIFLIILTSFISFSSNAQLDEKSKCNLIQTLMNDSLILKKVIFNESGNDEIYIIDTTQQFFGICTLFPILGKKVNIVHKRTDIGTKNKRLMLEIEKVVALPGKIFEIHVFYKTRNFYAIIKYQKRGDHFFHYKHKVGYY